MSPASPPLRGCPACHIRHTRRSVPIPDTRRETRKAHPHCAMDGRRRSKLTHAASRPYTPTSGWCCRDPPIPEGASHRSARTDQLGSDPASTAEVDSTDRLPPSPSCTSRYEKAPPPCGRIFVPDGRTAGHRQTCSPSDIQAVPGWRYSCRSGLPAERCVCETARPLCPPEARRCSPLVVGTLGAISSVGRVHAVPTGYLRDLASLEELYHDPKLDLRAVLLRCLSHEALLLQVSNLTPLLVLPFGAQSPLGLEALAQIWVPSTFTCQLLKASSPAPSVTPHELSCPRVLIAKGRPAATSAFPGPRSPAVQRYRQYGMLPGSSGSPWPKSDRLIDHRNPTSIRIPQEGFQPLCLPLAPGHRSSTRNPLLSALCIAALAMRAG
jgi:hypothetical protein